MQTVSSTYKRIFRQRGHVTEVRATIADTVYGIDSIYSAEQSLNLFSEDAPMIGGVCSGALKLRLIPQGVVPRMAEINLETRLVSPDGTQTSEWIPAGTYFVATRSRERNGAAITFTAADALLKADQKYLELSTLSQWPSPDSDVVDEIADLIGVTVDSRTVLAGYSVPIPEQDWTMREMLSWIAASNGGNWIITPAGELMLVTLQGVTSLLGTDSSHALLLGDSFILLSTGIPYENTRDLLGEDDTAAIKFGGDFIVMNSRGKDGSYNGSNNGWNIQRNARSAKSLGILPPFSGVKLWKSHEVTYEEQMVTETAGTAIQTYPVQVEVEQSVMAGTDDGRVIEADCPWATQAMADAILTRIQGFCWQGAVVDGAEVTPAAELGDPVICDGMSFALCSLNVVYDGAYAPTISAPADDEVDYEYHYKSQTERHLARKVTLNENYYGFRVTRAGGIEVINIVDGVETSRLRLNSNVQEFLNSNGVRALYFDPEAGEYKFRGNVTITEGSLGLSDTFSIFPSDTTEQDMEDYKDDHGDIPSGFNLFGWSSNDLYDFLRIYHIGEQAVFESPAGGNANFVFGQIDLNALLFLRAISKYPQFSGGSEGDQEIATVGYVKSLTVHPIIITQPQDITAQAGTSATASIVAARATGYQWYYRAAGATAWNRSTASTGTTANYTFSANANYNGRQIYCEVKNQYGSTYSDIITLTVTQ